MSAHFYLLACREYAIDSIHQSLLVVLEAQLGQLIIDLLWLDRVEILDQVGRVAFDRCWTGFHINRVTELVTSLARIKIFFLEA